MRHLLWYFAAFVLFMAVACTVYAQNTTNKGTKFRTAYINHIDGTVNGGSQMNPPVSSYLGNVRGISGRGIHIVSQQPVAIYAHVCAKSDSGATLILPVNTLGKDYLSINYTQLSNSLHLNTFPGCTVKVFTKNYE